MHTLFFILVVYLLESIFNTNVLNNDLGKFGYFITIIISSIHDTYLTIKSYKK